MKKGLYLVESVLLGQIPVKLKLTLNYWDYIYYDIYTHTPFTK